MQRPPILVRQPNLQICSANRAPLNLTECIKWNLWCLWSCLVGATSYITYIYIDRHTYILVYVCAPVVLMLFANALTRVANRHLRYAYATCVALNVFVRLYVGACACVFVHVCCVYIVRMFISTFCQLSCTLKRTKCQHK